MYHEVPGQASDGAQVRGHPKDPREVQLRINAEGDWIAEVDAAVGLDDHVVGAVELAAMVTIGHHRDLTIGLPAGHPSGVVLACDEAALGDRG